METQTSEEAGAVYCNVAGFDTDKRASKRSICMFPHFASESCAIVHLAYLNCLAWLLTVIKSFFCSASSHERTRQLE